MKHAVALLFASLALQASADTQLLPAGEFKGRDGRPGKDLTWRLVDSKGRALAARLTARHATVEFNFDYEHQSMLSAKNGLPAPASGWGRRFEWRDGVGLFVLATAWTRRASQMIGDQEYKYISPVIAYDPVTGDILDVLNAALTNIPNLDLDPVAQENMARLNSFFSTTNPESSMNPVLLACLAALGLPQTDATTAEQAVSAIAQLKTAQAALPVALCKALALPDAATAAQADAALATLKADAAKLPALTAEVATLKAAQGNPDPTQWVALNRFTDLANQVAALSATQANTEVDALIAAAHAEGKCPPVVEQVWRDVGKKDIAQLKALIASTPGNPALAGLSQTAGKQIATVVDPKAPLNAEELAICNNMGLTAEQFRAGAMVAAA